MNLGTQEIIIVLGVVVLLFGGKKIPELMRGVGQGVSELKKGLAEGSRPDLLKDEEEDEHNTPKSA